VEGRELAIQAANEIISDTKRVEREEILWALDLLDLHGTADDTGIDAVLTDMLLSGAQEAGTLSALDEAYGIWRLRQKVDAQVWIDGFPFDDQVERWQTWETELAQLAREKPEETWIKFCGTRLNMKPGLASQRRRIWEVYAVTLGIERPMLERASISCLAQAVGQVARDWNDGGTDDELMMMLFGETWEESGDRSFDREGFPEPSDFRITPATHDQVCNHLTARATDARPAPVRTTYDFQVDGEGRDRRVVVVCWMRRAGSAVAVPGDFARIVPLAGADDFTEEEWAEAWEAFWKVVRR